MKAKTKKTVAAVAVSVVYGVVLGFLSFSFQFGITCYPALVQVLGWLLTAVLRRVS